MTNYSQIIYLDGDLGKEVREIQKNLSDLTNSYACLNIREPHFTIGDGIALDDKEIDKYSEQLKNILKDIKPFVIEIKDYSCMEKLRGKSLLWFSPYVVYIGIVINKELQMLSELIKGASIKYPLWYIQSWPYTPHITIAFKDLTKEGFDRAKKFLDQKTFAWTFVVDRIHIAKEDWNWKRIAYKTINLQ